MKRSGPLKRTPLKPVSDKTRRKATERREVKKQVLARDKGCVAAKLAPGLECSPILDADEIVPRGRGGDPYDPTNVWVLCRTCHDVKHHGSPALATQIGLYGTQVEVAPIAKAVELCAEFANVKRRMGGRPKGRSTAVTIDQATEAIRELRARTEGEQ